MNTLLTAPDIEYLRGQQMKLDEDIISKNGITHDEWMDDLHTNHIIALRVEVAEFVNCAYDNWKYWKSKPIDRDRIIDEAVDVIHFLMLMWNKRSETIDSYGILLRVQWYLEREKGSNKRVLLKMLSTDNLELLMSYLLYVLNDYNFTTQDILGAYNRKNKVNFERLNSETY